MKTSVYHDGLIKKINVVLLLGTAAVMGGLAGCSHNSVKPVPDTGAAPSSDIKPSVKFVQKPRKVATPRQQQQASVQRSVAAPRPGKDKHHLEYDQKRQWYHQRWEQEQVQAEAEQAARQRYQVAWQSRNAGQAWQSSRSERANVDYSEKLVYAAVDRLRHRVTYNGAYIPISYPNGDVPSNIGVCTDTVIRSYRRLGVDLQRLVHEDISRAFYSYPNLPKWGLQGPDPNIDHRRVHNLKVFFARHGQRLPVTGNPYDYRPGDLVTWYLGGDQEHIGIVVNQRSAADPRRFMIVHNIGEGEKLEDVLFKMPISGHYRYFPGRANQPQLAAVQY